MGFGFWDSENFGFEDFGFGFGIRDFDFGPWVLKILVCDFWFGMWDLVSFLVFITRASFPIVFNCCLSRVPLKDILYYVSNFSPIFGPIHPKPVIYLLLLSNLPKL